MTPSPGIGLDATQPAGSAGAVTPSKFSVQVPGVASIVFARLTMVARVRSQLSQTASYAREKEFLENLKIVLANTSRL
jgi:hypothetical protein